jgi:hypothetical protein
MGCEKTNLVGEGVPAEKVLVNLDLTCAADPGIELGWVFGTISATG